MSARLRVLIAGGGIGGLTLAAALRRRGHEVRVFERTPKLAPVGAGIILAINALLALRRLGFADQVSSAGAPLREGTLRDVAGRVLQTTRFEALAEELGVPAVAFHRAELHQALLRAAGPDSVTLGSEVSRYEQHGGRVAVHFATGGSEEGELLVGADGLHSRIREQVAGPTALVYSGQTSWRGVTAPQALVEEGTSMETWGPGRRFGAVALSHQRAYWFGNFGDCCCCPS